MRAVMICWAVGCAAVAPVVSDDKLEADGEPSDGVDVERDCKWALAKLSARVHVEGDLSRTSFPLPVEAWRR